MPYSPPLYTRKPHNSFLLFCFMCLLSTYYCAVEEEKFRKECKEKQNFKQYKLI